MQILFAPRGGGWKETGDCDPLSLSNTSPDPLGDPLRRGILAAAVYTNLGIWYQVQTVHPQFRIWFCFLCSGWYRSRFSRVVGRVSHVFHYWWGRSFVPAATWGWAIIFRWICADREWVGNMADEGEGNRILSFHLQYGTVCYHYIGNYIPQSLPVEGG